MCQHRRDKHTVFQQCTCRKKHTIFVYELLTKNLLYAISVYKSWSQFKCYLHQSCNFFIHYNKYCLVKLIIYQGREQFSCCLRLAFFYYCYIIRESKMKYRLCMILKLQDADHIRAISTTLRYVSYACNFHECPRLRPRPLQMRWTLTILFSWSRSSRSSVY